MHTPQMRMSKGGDLRAWEQRYNHRQGKRLGRFSATERRTTKMTTARRKGTRRRRRRRKRRRKDYSKPTQ